MALAILNFEGFEQQYAVFKIDIGTNSFYKFSIGSGKKNTGGLSVIENVSSRTRLKKRGDKGAALFNTLEEVRLPRNLFNRTDRYVQLVSSKDESGKSPGISEVVSVPIEMQAIRNDLLDFNSSMSVMAVQQFNVNRRLAHSQSFLSQQLSLEDIISSLVRTVLPTAIQLLGNNGSAATPSTSGTAPATTLPPSTANAIGSLLNLFLQAASGRAPAVSHAHSYANADNTRNRFTDAANNQFSKPFIFGIDDALLATLAGPIIQQGIQLLPQLLNAANQHKLETLRANNQLMSSLNADVQRRLMLQQLVQNAPTAASGGSTMDQAQLLQLLQQLQPAAAAAATTVPPAAPAPAAPAATTPATTAAASLSYASTQVAYSLSNSVILSIENKHLQKWNGADTVVYQKNKALQFTVKLTVNPAPKAPLPKAIFRFVIKDSTTQQVVFEKRFNQKNIVANGLQTFQIGAEELAQVPVQKPLSLFAEMRWLSGTSGKEYKALGSEEVVFVTEYFVKETGKTLPEEKELTDLNTYRSFWNKVWESPVINKGNRKKLWEMNAALRYSVFLSPDHKANGMIETKLLQTEEDDEGVTAKTFGKIKSGIELSLTELNKLLTLWSGETPLDAAKLEAINNVAFAKKAAGEMLFTIKMKGREGVRGLVWAIPTFKLLELTLNKVAKTNEEGQVTECVEEKIKFPVPVNVLILGLKSKT